MPPRTYRKFILVFFLALLAIVSGVAAFNFVIDPLQSYRIPTLYKPIFWVGMQRYQVASLARHYAQNIVVIGQSTTENFLPSYIEKSWGKSASKLSISASTAHEQFLALRIALQTGHVTDVLWGVDAHAFMGSPTITNDSPAPFPLYLYRTDFISNFEYLLSLGTTRLSLMALTRNALSSDLDHYHVWYDRFVFSKTAVLAGWKGNCSQFEQKYRLSPDAVSKPMADSLPASIDLNLLSLARRYPNVTFHLFHPPYSLLNYMPAGAGMLLTTLTFRNVLAAEIRGYRNIHLYDFQVVEPIVADLDNYKDAIHFGLKTSQFIIDAIRDGQFRVASYEIEHNNQHLIELVNAFDLCRDGRLMD
jgi:hypothetical protein